MALGSTQTFQFLKPRNTLTLFATLSLFIGYTTFNPLLMALGAMCLATVIYGFVQAWGLLDDAKLSRVHQPRAFQGQSVAVQLRVAGTGRREPELVLIEDHFPPSATSRIRRLVEHPLTRNRVVEISFQGGCDHRRGLYILGPVHLQAYDVLGFFPRELIIEEFSELIVYPQAVDLQQANLLGEGTLFHVGLEMTQRTGFSEEFLGVRDYRTGDPPRIVHWRLSARHGKLIVKEFQEEITTLITFFLDLGKMGLVGVGDQTSVEYGIKCCASLAKRAIERGHAIQFLGVNDKVEHIPPGAGPAHLLSILDRLALLKAQGDSAFPVRVADLVPTLQRGSTAVLIMGATTVDVDQFAPLISLMIDRRILPVIVLIDDRGFIKIFREQEDRHYKAQPLEAVVSQLTLAGARVHVVRRAKSMEQALLQGLEQEGIL
jgi:uncharacterized protein (DUF58 family)